MYIASFCISRFIVMVQSFIQDINYDSAWRSGRKPFSNFSIIMCYEKSFTIHSISLHTEDVRLIRLKFFIESNGTFFKIGVITVVFYRQVNEGYGILLFGLIINKIEIFGVVCFRKQDGTPSVITSTSFQLP